MKFYDVYASELLKLEKLLAEERMVCTFHDKSYPISLTISPDASPEAQMELFALADDGATSRDARLTFTFPVGEIGMKISGRLIIPEALLNKIKGAAKKIHKAYLEGFFAERMSKPSKPKEETASPALMAPAPDVVDAEIVDAEIVEDVSTSDFADFFEDDDDAS